MMAEIRKRFFFFIMMVYVMPRLCSAEQGVLDWAHPQLLLLGLAWRGIWAHGVMIAIKLTRHQQRNHQVPDLSRTP